MSVEIGRNGEDLAAEYLVAHGAEVLERNWRNRWCEIDIIAFCDDTLRFVEVKYRSRVGYGTPLEYITVDKSNRLKRASLAWVQAHRYGGPYQIDVISVVGDLHKAQIEWLENAISD